MTKREEKRYLHFLANFPTVHPRRLGRHGNATLSDVWNSMSQALHPCTTTKILQIKNFLKFDEKCNNLVVKKKE